MQYPYPYSCHPLFSGANAVFRHPMDQPKNLQTTEVENPQNPEHGQDTNAPHSKSMPDPLVTLAQKTKENEFHKRFEKMNRNPIFSDNNLTDIFVYIKTHGCAKFIDVWDSKRKDAESDLNPNESSIREIQIALNLVRVIVEKINQIPASQKNGYAIVSEDFYLQNESELDQQPQLVHLVQLVAREGNICLSFKKLGTSVNPEMLLTIDEFNNGCSNEENS